MNSCSIIKATNEPSNEVIAYRYRLDMHDGSGCFSERNFSTITEYFIPSSKICINKLAAFKSENPRNLGSSKFFQRRFEPLTAVTLSQKLINKIENAVEQSSFNSLEKDEEYQLLFKIKPRNTTLVGREIVFIKDSFFDSYKTKGNNVIKKAIIQYILDGTIPDETSLNDVVQLAKKLSLIEKESLVHSVNLTLSIENEKLTEERSKAIKNIEKNHENQSLITSAILGGIGGAAISAVSRLHSVISTGLGLFGASAFKYADGVYKKYNENNLWDQREQRVRKIFDMIDDKLENDIKVTNSY